jgi:hypothetical protein
MEKAVPQPAGSRAAEQPFKVYISDQSASIASAGHTFAQEPQEMQASSAISYFSAPSEIASTGHSGWQLPQLRHASVILYAICISPP